MKGHELAERLVRQLMLPLLRGGELHLVEPVGEARALELADSLPGTRLFEEVLDLRLRAARRWAPVDDLGDISGADWLLVAALNDLLQLAHPDLTRGVRSSSNRRKLAHLVSRSIERAAAPHRVNEALARHALFSRVGQLCRHDTRVRWWTGHETFVGVAPPTRLLAWPQLRRVRQHVERVNLPDLPPAPDESFRGLLNRWLSTSPLTRLGLLGTPGFAFDWVGSVLSLTRDPSGRDLALRVVLDTTDVRGALAELSRAADELEPIHREAHAHAKRFALEASTRYQQLERRAEGAAFVRSR